MESDAPREWKEGLDEAFRARYRFEAALGMGSFGCVFRARDLALDRTVIVKVLRGQFPLGEVVAQRFLREARLLADLSHPRLVPLLDSGITAESLYMVSPDLGGASLDGWLATQGPRPAPEAGRVLGQILEALEYLHAQGLVHRDLKAANVLRFDDGQVRLIDLGLAGVDAARGSLTGTSEVLGTPSAMAPELIRGTPASARSDLYALGVLAYELLSGTSPFVGRTLGETMQNHLTRTVGPPAPPGGVVPGALAAWVLDLLEKQPEERPASAGAARRALERALAEAEAAGDPAPQGREGTTARWPRGVVEPRSAEPDPGARTSWVRGAGVAGVLSALALWGLAGRPAGLPPAPTLPPAGVEPRALPSEVARLAAQAALELESGFEDRSPGTRVLRSDPALWGEAFERMPSLARFHAWLAANGRPEALGAADLEALARADGSFRDLGFAPPFAPYRGLRPASEVVVPSPEDWRTPNLPPAGAWSSGSPPAWLRIPWTGWGARAYRLALEAEGRRAALELRLEQGLRTPSAAVTGDEALPDGFLEHYRLRSLMGRKQVPTRPLALLFGYYLISESGREAVMRWVDPDHTTLRRIAYCVARAVREEPHQADRVAYLFAWWADRLRIFVRGPLAHAPAAYALGFVPEGPVGAHLVGAVGQEAAQTSSTLPGAWHLPDVAVAWRRALVSSGETPGARARLGQAAQRGLLAVARTGDAPALEDFLGRARALAASMDPREREGFEALVPAARRELEEARTGGDQVPR